VVTTTFAWSYFALGRHLRRQPAWPALAVGLALVAAAVDLVGVVANIAVLPALAERGGTDSFQGAQLLAHALTDVAAFGLYTRFGETRRHGRNRVPGAGAREPVPDRRWRRWRCPARPTSCASS
jgi:hypothetical protein